MNTYEIVLYYEDGAWIAEVPELPGCATHAESEEAALNQIKTLIPEWIESARRCGHPVPKPRGRFAFA